jgi:hypothetical protein
MIPEVFSSNTHKCFDTYNTEVKISCCNFSRIFPNAFAPENDDDEDDDAAAAEVSAAAEEDCRRVLVVDDDLFTIEVPKHRDTIECFQDVVMVKKGRERQRERQRETEREEREERKKKWRLLKLYDEGAYTRPVVQPSII